MYFILQPFATWKSNTRLEYGRHREDTDDIIIQDIKPH